VRLQSDERTILVHVPTATPSRAEGAPAFVVNGPARGLLVGLRTDMAWRSWVHIAQRWAEFLERDGAGTATIQSTAQSGQKGAIDRGIVEEWAGKVDCGILGLGTCGSCTSYSVLDAVSLEEHRKPSLVVVCSEFETHARNMASFLGHPDLKVLVLPYPLEARPVEELEEIAVEYYPKALELLKVSV
jgi:hypothetical protein